MKGMLLAAAIGLGSMAATASAAPIVIDDGDASSTQQGYFYPASSAATPGKALNDDFLWANPNPTGTNAYFAWQFTDLTAGAYEVYVTWLADRSLPPYWSPGNGAASFEVINGGVINRGDPQWDIIPDAGATSLGTVVVNQSVNAAGLSYGGLQWFKLGDYSISGDKLSVILTNHSSSANTIMADGAMIQAVPEPMSLALVGLTSIMLLRRRNA